MKKLFTVDTVYHMIVLRGEPLTEQEIDAAFRGNANNQWYKALIQIINEYRMDYADKAAQHAVTNNPLGMARENGAYEALSNLLTVLDQKESSEG